MLIVDTFLKSNFDTRLESGRAGCGNFPARMIRIETEAKTFCG